MFQNGGVLARVAATGALAAGEVATVLVEGAAAAYDGSSWIGNVGIAGWSK